MWFISADILAFSFGFGLTDYTFFFFVATFGYHGIFGGFIDGIGAAGGYSDLGTRSSGRLGKALAKADCHPHGREGPREADD